MWSVPGKQLPMKTLWLLSVASEAALDPCEQLRTHGLGDVQETEGGDRRRGWDSRKQVARVTAAATAMTAMAAKTVLNP